MEDDLKVFGLSSVKSELLYSFGPWYPHLRITPRLKLGKLNPRVQNPWLQRANCTTPFYIRDLSILGIGGSGHGTSHALVPRDDCTEMWKAAGKIGLGMRLSGSSYVDFEKVC